MISKTTKTGVSIFTPFFNVGKTPKETEPLLYQDSILGKMILAIYRKARLLEPQSLNFDLEEYLDRDYE